MGSLKRCHEWSKRRIDPHGRCFLFLMNVRTVVVNSAIHDVSIFLCQRKGVAVDVMHLWFLSACLLMNVNILHMINYITVARGYVLVTACCPSHATVYHYYKTKEASYVVIHLATCRKAVFGYIDSFPTGGCLYLLIHVCCITFFCFPAFLFLHILMLSGVLPGPWERSRRLASAVTCQINPVLGPFKVCRQEVVHIPC